MDQEQKLITVIQEETKRTKAKEEAGRSPTWSILRALQKINKAKRKIMLFIGKPKERSKMICNKAERLEGPGEAVMSAPPLFQPAGRGNLKFWGEDDGPTVVVVVWEL